MSASYARSQSGETTYTSRVAAYLDDDFHPGERIGAPPPNRTAKLIRRTLLLGAVTGFGVWAYAYDSAGWMPWLAKQATAVMATAMKAKQPQNAADAAPEKLAPIDPAAETEALRRMAEAVAPSPPPTAPSATTPAEQPAAAPVVTGALPPAEDADAPADTGPPEPLPPPYVDKSDPLQVKAAAAGLHPGLSHALLSKLTAADYKNATHAIDTALAETADGDTFAWPRQKKPELALFEIHFVPGAAPNCRRYVVTVTRENWATTALPMERCGVKRAVRKPATKAG